jgi:hypothetical protein
MRLQGGSFTGFRLARIRRATSQGPLLQGRGLGSTLSFFAGLNGRLLFESKSVVNQCLARIGIGSWGGTDTPRFFKAAPSCAKVISSRGTTAKGSAAATFFVFFSASAYDCTFLPKTMCCKSLSFPFPAQKTGSVTMR